MIPGCSVTVNYTATILDTALAGDTVDNTANLTYTSLPGSAARLSAMARAGSTTT